MLLAQIHRAAYRPAGWIFQALLIGLFFLGSYSRLPDFSAERFSASRSTLDAPKAFIDRVTLHRSLESFSTQTHADLFGSRSQAYFHVHCTHVFRLAPNEPPCRWFVPSFLSIRAPPLSRA
jgi:hypothetical protein